VDWLSELRIIYRGEAGNECPGLKPCNERQFAFDWERRPAAGPVLDGLYIPRSWHLADGNSHARRGPRRDESGGCYS
jgi:hypothetical protein